MVLQDTGNAVCENGRPEQNDNFRKTSVGTIRKDTKGIPKKTIFFGVCTDV